MNWTKRQWIAMLCAMLLAMSLSMAALGASAETAPAATDQAQASGSEQSDQAEAGALTAQAQITLIEAQQAFQALYPDWTIVSAKPEEENSVPAYAIEATDANGAMLEVTISAVDGSVIPERIGEQNGENDKNEQSEPNDKGDQNEGEPQDGNTEAGSN